MIKLAFANILTAFDDSTVGSKVTNREFFLASIREGIESFDFSAETNPEVRTTGQGMIKLHPNATNFVSAGVGQHVDDPDAYVLRSWRGKVGTYLKRERATKVDSVAVIVYTRAAYMCDPDVQADPDEAYRINDLEATHILVAVLANAGPRAPLSPGRLVSNLAGGNNDALAWTADEIRAKARESSEYSSEWGVVAD